MKQINLNDTIKVKLTEFGKHIYYHQYDDLIKNGLDITRAWPETDADGYSEFQLSAFIEVFGPYMRRGGPNVILDMTIYLDDESVGAEK